MKALLLIGAIALSVSSYGQTADKQPNCDDIDGVKVTNWKVVPDGYTGVAIICHWEKVIGFRNWKDGKADGLAKGWYPNGNFEGKLEYKQNWKDGKLDGLQQRWHANGHLEFKKNWKDGKLDGLTQGWDYYNNGQLRYEENWKDGKEDGLHQKWYSNGQLEYKKNYKDGEIIDDYVVYYKPDGAIFKIKYYEEGVFQRCEGDCL